MQPVPHKNPSLQCVAAVHRRDCASAKDYFVIVGKIIMAATLQSSDTRKTGYFYKRGKAYNVMLCCY